MYSGAIAATIGLARRGVATVTSPAPDRSAPSAARCAAPVLSERAGDDQHAAVVALVAVGRARGVTSSRIALARQQLDARAVERLDDRGRDADVGDDDVAGARLGRRQDERQLRRRERDRHARLDRVAIGSCESADRPDGRSIETTGMPEALTSATTVSISPESGAFRPVPKIASTISVQSLTSREVQLPRLAVGDLDDGEAEPAEDLEVRPRVARTSATRPIRNTDDVDAALQQRARDDEAVAAVVAAAAEHGDLALDAGRRTSPPSPPRPGGRRSPSARATGCRSRRSSAIGLAHLLRRSGRACVLPRHCIIKGHIYCRHCVRLRCNDARSGFRQRARSRRRDHAVIPVFDHGFLYGEGVYETLRTYNGEPFLFDRHMRRLRQSAQHDRADGAARRREIHCAWIRETMEAAGRDARGLHPDPGHARRRRADLRSAPRPPSIVVIVKPHVDPPRASTSEGSSSRSWTSSATIPAR